MVSSVLIDNWTLQNAGELLHRRLTGESTTELDFSSDSQALHYRPISQDLVSIDCLCQLLHHIVLADELQVDEDFAESWAEFGHLALLKARRVIRPMPFKYLEAQWEPRRESMEDLLCFCPELRERHAQNKTAYAATQQSLDPMLAQLVWGGAGMLARADYFRTLYEPHPLRQRLFLRAGVISPPSALDQLSSFVEEEALKLCQRADRTGFFVRFRLPATIVQILDSASSLSQLIPAALELRDAYADLRLWLGKLQAALDKEDAREVLAQRKPLLSVAQYLATLSTANPAGDVSIQFGVTWLPKVTMKAGSLVNSAQNCFGVRAQITRLVLTEQGRSRFRKLLKLLGEDQTARGAALENAFAHRHSMSLAD